MPSCEEQKRIAETRSAWGEHCRRMGWDWNSQSYIVVDNQDDGNDNDNDHDACCMMTCTGKAATVEGRAAGIEIAGAAESSKQLVSKLWTMDGGCTELQCFPLKTGNSFEFWVKDDVRPINHTYMQGQRTYFGLEAHISQRCVNICTNWSLRYLFVLVWAQSQFFIIHLEVVYIGTKSEHWSLRQSLCPRFEFCSNCWICQSCFIDFSKGRLPEERNAFFRALPERGGNAGMSCYMITVMCSM